MTIKHICKILTLTTALAIVGGQPGHAFSIQDIEFHNEAVDTVRINQLLTSAIAAHPSTTGDCVVMIGEQLLGKPYVAHTLEGDSERLRVNLDELDCTTFVETVAALALTATDQRSSWRDFVGMLESLRYRGGQIGDYSSRLHYIADWVVDNTYRGNLRDVSTNIDGVRYAVKTIDFMSANRDKYPSLADSAIYEHIRNIETGYRNHRFPYIIPSLIGKKKAISEMRNGDLLAFTSVLRNLDVTHMGILVMRDGIPYVMHASMSAGKVVLSDVPLNEFLRRNRHFNGVRILRLRD